MNELVVIILCYVAIGLLIYSIAVDTDIPRKEQIRYSVIWPWLLIATAGCFLWDFTFPED